MAGGWIRDGVVQDQISDQVSDSLKFARSLMPVG